MLKPDSGPTIVSAAAMRAAEAAAIAAGTSALTLMERAAEGAARAIMAFAPARLGAVTHPGAHGETHVFADI